MRLNGYRAFLMGTATDLPCRGYRLRVQRREGVEAAAELNGRIDTAAGLRALTEAHHGTEY